MQRQGETLRKQLQVCPAHLNAVGDLFYEMQKS